MKLYRIHLPQTSPQCLLFALALMVAPLRARADDLLTFPGVVVEEIGPLPELNQSGLKAGDILVSWRQPASDPAYTSPQHGPLQTILDWTWLTAEKAPIGPILLARQNGAGIQEILIPRGLADVRVRPNLESGALNLYDNGRLRIDLGDVAEGFCWWDQLARKARAGADHALSTWLRLQMAAILSEHNQWSEAVAILESALQEEAMPAARAAVLEDLGTGFRKWGQFQLAREAYHAALNERALISSDALASARISHFLALTERYENPNQADDLLAAAVEQLQRVAPRSALLASALNNRGVVQLGRDELSQARDDFELAFDLYTDNEPGGLNVARVMNNLGLTATASGRLQEAEEWHSAALKLRSLLAPCSLEVAQSLQNLASAEVDMGNLGKGKDLARQALYILHDFPDDFRPQGFAFETLAHIAFQTGNSVESEILYRGSLALFEKAGPRSLDVARALANLSVVLSDQGDLEGAEDTLKESLKVGQAIAPEGLAITQTLTNLGLLKIRRGELDEAEELLKRSLRIIERLAPGTENEAAALNNLGILAFARFDADEAWYFDNRSLGVARRLPRPNRDEAHSLNNLGNVALIQGKYEEAEEDFKEALAIKSKLFPGSSEVASGFSSLAHLYWMKGDLVQARRYYETSLALQPRATFADSPRTYALLDLGTILADSGEIYTALGYFREALNVTQKSNPEGIEQAFALHAIGKILHRQGKREEALAYLRNSLNILETSSRRLGGSEDVKAGFRHQYEELYRDLVDLLVESGLQREAFRVLESYRAQALLNMLASRDLSFSIDLPPALEAERRKLEHRYDEIQANLSRGEGTLDQLLGLRSRLKEIDRQIVQLSPRLSALRGPKPLDLEMAGQALDQGTAMMYYDVGRDKTRLWVVEAEGGPKLYLLDAGKNRLEDDISQYRSIIKETRAGSRRLESLIAAGGRLYETLIAPAEEILSRNKRILIIPDGPLRLLPFASLVRKMKGKASDGSEWLYLAEWKPLHTTLSATLFAELKGLRREHGSSSPSASTIDLAAFGDPGFPAGLKGRTVTIAEPQLRSATKGGVDFSPLPFSRKEVEEIIGLFPRRTRVFLGLDASEENAKLLPRDTRIVHFATHTVVNERFPLNSAVVLSIPERFEEGKDNGLLQAWEIFEKVRLDADLVVLSACESGLGKELGGEGLIGLTRAFQYAGARSVMASLWKISDRTTAELMVRFYKHLKGGLPKDEALQAAQMELIHGPIRVKNEKGEEEEIDSSAPYYWAAFQIYGDWQ